MVVTQTWKRRTEPDIHIEKAKTLRSSHAVPPKGPSTAKMSVPPRYSDCGPPRKRVTSRALIEMTFMNSARKNNAKRIDEYSVWNPNEFLLNLDQVKWRAV